MDERARQQASAEALSGSTGSETIIARNVHLTYRVYEDERRPTMRRFVVRRFRPREYRAVRAVRGISLTLQEGEALGIIGRNGSGKSTLLRVLAGLLPPTDGVVFARSTPVLLGVGAVLHPELSGRRNIYLGCTALGMDRAEVDLRYEEIVDFAGIGEFIDMPLRTYSSGMKARLQFSIASVLTPDVLLIDEALAVGDEEFKQKSEARVREMLAEAGSVILVSHSMRSIRDMCGRALWMDRGEVVADGPVEEVIARYEEATHAHTSS